MWSSLGRQKIKSGLLVFSGLHVLSLVRRHVYTGNQDKKFSQTKNEDIAFVLIDVWSMAAADPIPALVGLSLSHQRI